MRFTIILLISTLWVGMAPTKAKSGELEVAAAQSVMQCMTNCIKHEGNSASAKSTCKLRCANVPMPNAGGAPKKDCMAVYKKCNRSCPKNGKACKKQCKAGLMSCG